MDQVQEELSRWQKRFPANKSNENHQENHHDERYEEVSSNFQKALGVQNKEESNLQQWIESIQCAENIMARSNLFLDETDLDTGNILADIDAILQQDDLDEHQLDADANLSVHSTAISSSPTSSDYDDIRIRQMQSQALVHFNLNLEGTYLNVWHRWCQDKRERQESLIEWYRASTIQARLRRRFQAWHRHGRFARHKMQSYLRLKRDRQVERVFCTWFNIIRNELNQEKNIHQTILKKYAMIAWKTDCTSSMKSNTRATMHHVQNLLAKSIHAFHLVLKDKRTPLSRQVGGIQGGRRQTRNRERLRCKSLPIGDTSPMKAPKVKRHNPSKYPIVPPEQTIEKENLINGSNDFERNVTKRGKPKRSVLGGVRKKVGLSDDVSTRLCDNRYDEDEVERRSYLQKKRQERMKQLAKQKELERMKRAWQLATIHFSFCLLRRCFSSAWFSFLQEQQLKMLKAVTFHTQILLEHGLHHFKRNVSQKRKLAFDMERQKFIQAEQHYCDRFRSRVLDQWRAISIHSHSVLYHRAESIGRLYRKKRLVELWLSHLAREKMKMVEWGAIVEVRARKNILKWALRRWSGGVRMIQWEREEESKVKEKWNEVREWLVDI